MNNIQLIIVNQIQYKNLVFVVSIFQATFPCQNLSWKSSELCSSGGANIQTMKIREKEHIIPELTASLNISSL